MEMTSLYLTTPLPMNSDTSIDDPSSENNLRDLWAELNNEGASHLENSLWVEAISTLTSALSIAVNWDDTNERSDAGNVSREMWSSQLRVVAADIPSGMETAFARSTAPCTITEASPPTVASKRKKTRRRRVRRRNSFSSTESSKEVSRRESRRRAPASHINSRRRARSAMGRMTGEIIITEDILQFHQKYVYPKPLRVMDRYNIPSAIELAIYVVFNLALAYQLQALSDENVAAAAAMVGFPRTRTQKPSSSPIWSRVIRLYHLANDWVDQQQQMMDETEHALVDPNSPLWTPTYTLALPNNLACAYHASGDDVGSNVYWQQALSHLWCILDVGCTSQVECFSQILENAAHVMDGGSPHGSSSMGVRTATAA